MAQEKVGRNDPCPCGSGRKFKQCCGSASRLPAQDAGSRLAALFEQGVGCHGRGDQRGAELAFQQMLAIDPEQPDALHGLGALAHELGRSELAVDLIGRAIKRKPNFGMHYNMGLALRAQGRLDEARTQFAAATQLKPDWADAHCNLGTTLLDLGMPAQAEASYREALRWAPQMLDVQSNLLMTRLYDPAASATQLAQEHLVAGGLFARTPSSPGRSPSKAKPERIGFVSGDFRVHPVGLLIEGLLEKLCGYQTYSFYVYSNNGRDDELTSRLRALSLIWRDIRDMDDQTVARQIAADEIDVLVDLSGHSAGGRLPVFARRPAPFQITWLGYGLTTGVPGMDAVLVDPYSYAVDDAQLYSEQPLLLPDTRLFFTPPVGSPEVGPLPALGRGFVTFACFNNLAKINARVAHAWARIMQRLPGSRLKLKGRQYHHESSRRHVLQMLMDAGVGTERVDFGGFESREHYMNAYGEVDIALDCFPFPGGTTTLEGLWMGVPVVTLSGRQLIARQGESILQNLRLCEWIANSEDDFVERAVRLATAVEALAELRLNLRARLAASPLCQTERFAAAWLQAVETGWGQAIMGSTHRTGDSR